MRSTKIIVMDISWDSYYGRQIFRGMYQYARPHRPWTFVRANLYGDTKRLREHADTVGMISMRPPRAYLADARRYRLTTVGVGVWAPRSEFTGLPYVDVDSEALGEMAAEYFIQRGFRHFGMIASDKTFESSYRGEAFAAALRRRGLACDAFDRKKKYPQSGKPLHGIADTSEWIRRWLAGIPKPAGVFCVNDSVGLWVCGVCRRAEVHVPDEVAVLAAENDEMFCEMIHPSLSSIRLPGEQVGYRAAKMLDDMLRGRRPPKRPILLPPAGVVTRQSTDVMAIEDRYIVEAVRFIREHAHEGIRVEDVIAKVSLSRRPLERRFRAILGRSPFAEVRRVQIEHIKMLLSQTDKTLEVIAPECGFDSVTRMSPAFKKAIGMPPGAYRKQFRNH